MSLLTCLCGLKIRTKECISQRRKGEEEKEKEKEKTTKEKNIQMKTCGKRILMHLLHYQQSNNDLGKFSWKGVTKDMMYFILIILILLEVKYNELNV